METFSALLALCAGNSPVPVNSPHKGQWRRALMFTLICARIKGWVNNRKAGDLRRNHVHYDVTVMIHQLYTRSSIIRPGPDLSPYWRYQPIMVWWRHQTGPTLTQLLACCMMAPSHYLKLCSLIILLHSYDGNFAGNVQDTYNSYKLKHWLFNITAASPRVLLWGRWANG